MCPPFLSYIWPTRPWKPKGFLWDKRERVCLDSRSGRHRTSSPGSTQEIWHLNTHTHTHVHETAGAEWCCIREWVLVKRWWMVEGGVTWQQLKQSGTEWTREARRLFTTRPSMSYSGPLQQHDAPSVCTRVHARVCARHFAIRSVLRDQSRVKR